MSNLLPIPDNLMSGPVKDALQGKIRDDGARRWSEHTRILPELKNGDFVQMQNLRGRNPLKSDYNGIIVGRHNVNSYAVKMNGNDRITVRNRATLRKILPPVTVHNLPLVQGPVIVGPDPEPAAGGRQARPDGERRLGLRSGGIHGSNFPMAGGIADGSTGQKEYDSCELILRAASRMENSGCLNDLR